MSEVRWNNVMFFFRLSQVKTAFFAESQRFLFCLENLWFCMCGNLFAWDWSPCVTIYLCWIEVPSDLEIVDYLGFSRSSNFELYIYFFKFWAFQLFKFWTFFFSNFELFRCSNFEFLIVFSNFELIVMFKYWKKLL